MRLPALLGPLLVALTWTQPVHAAPPDDDDEPEQPAAEPQDDDAKPDDDKKPANPEPDDDDDVKDAGPPDADDNKPDNADDNKPDNADDNNPDAADDNKPGADDDDKPDDNADAKPDNDDNDADDKPDTDDHDDDDDVPLAASVEQLDDGVGLDAEGEVVLTCAHADHDCDGTIEPDELAQEQAFAEAFADIPDEVTDAALDQRPEDAELLPSLTVEDFRKLVRLAKARVLTQMQIKLAAKADQRMATIGKLIALFSLLGLLLLLAPVVLGKRYPGKAGLLAKYGALAAVTFVVIVNLFGGALYLMRGTQAQLAEYTNPQIAVAGGFFDILDEHAEDFIVTGKELFAPTLEQLARGDNDAPSALLIANGRKIVQDASVFTDIAALVKRVDWLFGVIPIVLLIVTMALFVRSVLPTLSAIVQLPAQAAAGRSDAGKDVVAGSMRRVIGEFLATLCTIGLLFLLTVLAASILGLVVKPALQSLLSYFSLSVSYLQFVDQASAGLVYVTLISVILFLVLNLAAFIAAMSLFLGKAQKIFQRRFNDGVPLAQHARFWRWGPLAAALIMLVPLLYVYIARWGLNAIDDATTAGITDAELISWSSLMLAGPLFLVVGFLALLWLARALKALKFLASYKVPAPPTT